jgi:hypothetical protein
MDFQLLIALLILLLSISYLGNKFLGKRLKSAVSSDDQNEDSSCGPSCKCGK